MTVALDPKGQGPTPGQRSPLVGVGVRTADEGGIKVCGVPVGTDDVVVEGSIVIVRDEERKQSRGYCLE